MISKIQYITNSATHQEILNEVNDAISAGIDWVQLRIKDESLDFFQIAADVKELCQDQTTFIINDRVEVAEKIGADGVHLGKNDMHPELARDILGDKIIGGTANSIEDIRRIEKWVDYIGVGPYKFTTTKKELSPILGIEGYQEILSKGVSVPVIAIGGLDIADTRLIMNSTEVYGVAISGLIKNAPDKAEIVEHLKEAIYGKVENRR